MNSQRTLNTLPSGATYGVSFVSILEKNTYITKGSTLFSFAEYPQLLPGRDCVEKTPPKWQENSYSHIPNHA